MKDRKIIVDTEKRKHSAATVLKQFPNINSFSKGKILLLTVISICRAFEPPNTEIDSKVRLRLL